MNPHGKDNIWRIQGEGVIVNDCAIAEIGTTLGYNDDEKSHVLVYSNHPLTVGLTLFLIDAPDGTYDASLLPQMAIANLLSPVRVRTGLLRVESAITDVLSRCFIYQSAYREKIPSGLPCYVVRGSTDLVTRLLSARGRKHKTETISAAQET